jgi:hypothetical protein
MRAFTHPWRCPILSLACSHARLHASVAVPDLASRVLACAPSHILAAFPCFSNSRVFDRRLPCDPEPVSRTPVLSMALCRAVSDPVSRIPVPSIGHFLAESFSIRTPNRVRPTRANINYSFAELLLRWRRWCDGERRGTTNPGKLSRHDGSRG